MLSSLYFSPVGSVNSMGFCIFPDCSSSICAVIISGADNMSRCQLGCVMMVLYRLVVFSLGVFWVRNWMMLR